MWRYEGRQGMMRNYEEWWGMVMNGENWGMVRNDKGLWEKMSRFPANSARRVRSLCVIYLNTTSGSFKDTRFQVPVQYYFILRQTTMNSAGSSRTQVKRRCSQMVNGSQWLLRRVLPPVVVQVPLSGFNWKHNPGNKLALHFNIYTFSEY